MRNVALFLLLAVWLVPTASAFVYRSGDEIYLTGNYEEDLYLFGSSVNFEGNLRGDMISAARTITVNGELDGSVNAFAQRVTINGDVRRSLRGAAQFFTINSTVEGDVVAFAQEVILTGDALLMHDVALFGAELVVDGVIEGNCDLRGGAVTISGRVDGDVKIRADKITISPSAVIEGDLDYESTSRAKIAAEAQIVGETRYKKITRSSKNEVELPMSPPPTSWLWSFLFFCGTFIIGLVLILFKRDMVERIATDMRHRVLLHGLLGLLLLIVVPVLILLLAITFIGLPLAAAGTTVYILLFIVSKIFVGITLGMVIISWFKHEGRISLGWSLLLGMILLSLLFKIPFFGWLVYIAAWAIGAGAITFCFFRRRVPATEPSTGATSA
jgi:cytoskeletal protein CcmA (bactofilin family)